MSDPAVYNDRREAAEVGRRLKELDLDPHKLAREWRGATRGTSPRRATTPTSRELIPDLEARTATLEEELRLALVPTDPADRKDVIVEVRQGVGGDEAALWAGDIYRMLARYAERRGYKVEELKASASDGGGYKEVDVRGQGRRRVLASSSGRAARTACSACPRPESQGRIHTSTATVAVMPEAEEVEVRDRPERPQDRRLPLDRPGRPVGQHDRLGRAHHAPADRRRRRDAGREVAASEPARRRCASCARASTSASWSGSSAELDATRQRADRLRRARREDPHLQLPREPRSPTTAIKLTVHQLDQILEGELDDFTEALDDRRSPPRARRRDRARGARRGASGGSPRQGVETPRVDAELARRARCSGRRGSELCTPDRPLTEVERTLARAPRSARGARAARVRPRRVGLPPPDAEAPTRGRSCRDPRRRSLVERALALSAELEQPRDPRRRRRLGRDRARARRTSARTRG